MNTFGTLFRFTDFGESHGVAVGGVIDGCPAGVQLDKDQIAYDLDRRAGRIGEYEVGVSERAKNERDEIEWLSGLQEMVTLGTPIAFLVRNEQALPQDYAAYQEVFRPGHADFTYAQKYGIRACAGGGRASARETVARVIAGSIAKQILASFGVQIEAYVSQVGEAKGSASIRERLLKVRQAGDSIGGVVSAQITGLPAGVGEPIFDKLSARLAYAMLSINACKGFAYGSGFAQMGLTGSQLNDAMPFQTNYAGGILGGISNGQPVCFEVAFKPTPSIAIPQQTVSQTGEIQTVCVHGRHDVCVALRAPVIVEAMAAMTVLDLLLQERCSRVRA